MPITQSASLKECHLGSLASIKTWKDYLACAGLPDDVFIKDDSRQQYWVNYHVESVAQRMGSAMCANDADCMLNAIAVTTLGISDNMKGLVPDHDSSHAFFSLVQKEGIKITPPSGNEIKYDSITSFANAMTQSLRADEAVGQTSYVSALASFALVMAKRGQLKQKHHAAVEQNCKLADPGFTLLKENALNTWHRKVGVRIAINSAGWELLFENIKTIAPTTWERFQSHLEFAKGGPAKVTFITDALKVARFPWGSFCKEFGMGQELQDYKRCAAAFLKYPYLMLDPIGSVKSADLPLGQFNQLADCARHVLKEAGSKTVGSYHGNWNKDLPAHKWITEWFKVHTEQALNINIHSDGGKDVDAFPEATDLAKFEKEVELRIKKHELEEKVDRAEHRIADNKRKREERRARQEARMRRMTVLTNAAEQKATFEIALAKQMGAQARVDGNYDAVIQHLQSIKVRIPGGQDDYDDDDN